MPLNAAPGPVSVSSLTQGNGITGPRGKPPGYRGPPPAIPQTASRGLHTQQQQKSFRVPVSNASTRAPSRVVLPTINEDATDLTAQFSKMEVKEQERPKEKVYNPSMGPSPSMMTTVSATLSAAPSDGTMGSVARVVNTAACVLGRFRKRNFKRGDVISLPYHTSNSNPHVDPQDPNLSYTVVGPVYSKRRMVVVLWMYKETMFCVPMYSFNGKGLRSKPKHIKEDYVSVVNKGDVNFENQGVHPPIQVECKWPVDKNTTIKLVGGVDVPYKADIAKAGRLPRESFGRLMMLWKNLSGTAWGQPYQD